MQPQVGGALRLQFNIVIIKVKATIPLTRPTLVQRRWGQFIHKFL